jgi:ABC-2 type transport system ATP-binding protein
VHEATGDARFAGRLRHPLTGARRHPVTGARRRAGRVCHPERGAAAPPPYAAQAAAAPPPPIRARDPTGPPRTIGPPAVSGDHGYPAAVTLQIDHVTKRFAQTLALDDLAFEVPRGRIFGFLGANGAGKTTTMRICLGILHPDAGEIRWDGAPTTALPRRTWGYLPEERGLYPRMTVLDQLVYFASLYGHPADQARDDARHWLTRFRIPEYATRRAEELSKGNQQKVQFIAAILHRPDVLLMDEPFTGLDPVNLALLREAFLELRDEGRTIVFSTHQMEAAEALCESLAIVDRGKVVAAGTIGELKRASRARTVRLGVEGESLPPWMTELPGVLAARPGAGFAELELAAGVEPSSIVAAAVARGARVTRFEVAEPSLEAIFIELVGRPADEEPTLADDPGASGLSVIEGAA